MMPVGFACFPKMAAAPADQAMPGAKQNVCNFALSNPGTLY
jgi:hypothetical protein